MPKKATMMRRASVQVENFQTPVKASAKQVEEQEIAAIQAQLDALAAASDAVSETVSEATKAIKDGFSTYRLMLRRRRRRGAISLAGRLLSVAAVGGECIRHDVGVILQEVLLLPGSSLLVTTHPRFRATAKRSS